uniref:Uncharacterized protein n=1 Tax=Vitrella brassicaformis TaxID=1169539 RepID=A0A7S1P4C2_9ALVE
MVVCLQLPVLVISRTPLCSVDPEVRRIAPSLPPLPHVIPDVLMMVVMFVRSQLPPLRRVVCRFGGEGISTHGTGQQEGANEAHKQLHHAGERKRGQRSKG